MSLARGDDQRVLPALIAIEHFIKQAFANAGGGNGDFLRLGLAQNFVEHDGAIGEQRAAGRRDGFDRDQRIGVGALDEPGKIGGLHGGDRVAMHDAHEIIALAHMQSGERAPCSADGIERAAAQAFENFGLAQRLAHDFHRRLRRLVRGIHERQPAERQSDPLADPRALHVDQFERAAAQIGDDAVGLIKGRDDAERREFGFPLAGQKRDGRADRIGRGFDEFRAIRRIARGGGRHDMEVLDIHDGDQRLEAAHGGERLFDARRRQPSGRRHAMADGAHGFFVEDGRRRAAEPVIDDEAHRIRADVDNRDRMFGLDPSKKIRKQFEHPRLYRFSRRFKQRLGARIPVPICRAPTDLDWS